MFADSVCSNPLSPVHLNSIVPLAVATVVNDRNGLAAIAGEVGAEDFLPVIGTHELGDDVAGDRLTHVVVAVAGFHAVRDQFLDRDDLALLGLSRNIDESARHYTGSSRQAAM